jgi:transcriptional antiterminator NusG
VPWYALHVRSQTESLVADKLDRIGLEGYYPHLLQKSKDGKRSIEKKFFPGYVFGRFAFDDRGHVIEIPQVASILGIGSHALAIPDAEVEAVRQMVSAPAAITTVTECVYVGAGDRVRVLRGPLRGLEGYVAYARNTARVIVSVTMLQRSISAEVDTDWLAVIERALPIAA